MDYSIRQANRVLEETWVIKSQLDRHGPVLVVGTIRSMYWGAFLGSRVSMKLTGLYERLLWKNGGHVMRKTAPAIHQPSSTVIDNAAALQGIVHQRRC